MTVFRVSRTGGGGLPYRITRRVAWRSPTHGVRCSAAETSWHDLVTAISLCLTPGAAFSHQTAAQLHGLPLPADSQDAIPVHVTVPLDVARGSRHQVKWHRKAIAGRVISIQHLPVTDPARTWLDLGPHLDLPDLVAVTDVILRRQPRIELLVPARTPGAARLRQALLLADGRSLSPRESVLRVHLRLAGLPPPEVNHHVIADGELIGCGDLVWPAYLLYVEYDGGHHDDPRQRHQDAQTRNQLAQLGWRVRIVTSAMSPHAAVEMLTHELRSAGWSG